MNNNSAVAQESLSLSPVAASLTPVYIGRETSTGEQFLMRKADLPANSGLPQTMIREAFYLKSLQSPYVPILRDIVLSPTSLFFLTDDCGQTLSSLLPTIRTQTIPKIAYNLLKAVEFIGNRKVVHLAISPDNVFVDEEGNVRLDGFYYARKMELDQRNVSHESYFDAYTSPELLNHCHSASSASDMWSFALIFLSLHTKSVLRTVRNREDLLGFIARMIAQGGNQIGDEKMREMAPSMGQMERNLLGKVLKLDPGSRLTATQAIAHPYFNSVRRGDNASPVED